MGPLVSEMVPSDSLPYHGGMPRGCMLGPTMSKIEALGTPSPVRTERSVRRSTDANDVYPGESDNVLDISQFSTQSQHIIRELQCQIKEKRQERARLKEEKIALNWLKEEKIAVNRSQSRSPPRLVDHGNLGATGFQPPDNLQRVPEPLQRLSEPPLVLPREPLVCAAKQQPVIDEGNQLVSGQVNDVSIKSLCDIHQGTQAGRPPSHGDGSANAIMLQEG